jgi:PKD repeat protein
MDQKLPSDKLKERPHPWRLAGMIAAAILVVSSAGVGAYALTHNITAPAVPRAQYEVPANAAPVAVIAVATADLTVTVDGSGSSDADGVITSYLWDFGDGTTSEDVTATHAYAAAGDYTITLTVRDDGEHPATGTTTSTVTATNPPPPPPPAPPASGGGGGYSYGSYPSGAIPPNLPGTDAPDTSACASGSASTVGGVPRCD